MANRWGNSGNSATLYFLGGSKITADSDYSHEIKRCLLLGRKAMTNLDSILKSRGITFPKKVSIVKAMVFPIVMCQSENWNIQFNSVDQSCPTLWDPMNRNMPGFPDHHKLPEFTQTHVHQVGDAIQPSHPLLSPSPPAPNPSQHQGLFKWVSSSHQVAKYWSFSLNISPSNEHPGLISFRMDWLDLLTVQGTLTLTHCISFVEIQVISYGSCCSHMDYY